ncbi:MAG: hypothetical protein Q8Q56_01345 [Alphaproteobacteria bacterium]|nr:hypothetical protein [Alphaproteobacteria bacterium]
MLFFRIVSLILFIQCGVESAAAALSSKEVLPDSPNIQQFMIARMVDVVDARPYGDILDRMQSDGGGDDEETAKRRVAIAQAFWANYCDAKMKQEPLPSSDERRLFANLLALIRDPKAPTIERLKIEDEKEMLENAYVKFRISCDLLLADYDAVRLDNLWRENAGGAEVSIEVGKCMEWFIKILLSKDAHVPQGRSILIGRLVQVADFLNELATSDDLDQRSRAKAMLEECIIANASECPDRAIAGLDDMDFDMALFCAPNLESAIHFLVRQYKKYLIQECLVEHKYAESAEEYVYLLLLLNDHFNLGVASAGIWSAQCGARKPFDKAARLLMDSLSVEGVCHFIAKHPAFRNFLRSKTEYRDAIETAASDPDLAEDAVYAYVRRIVESYIHSTFILEGEKFQELTSKDIAEMNLFLVGSSLVSGVILWDHS